MRRPHPAPRPMRSPVPTDGRTACHRRPAWLDSLPRCSDLPRTRRPACLGVEAEGTCDDHGLTGLTPNAPDLAKLLPPAGPGHLAGDEARSARPATPDARAIADELTARQISLSLGGSVYDPTDAMGRLLFNLLAIVARSSTPTSSGCAPSRAWRSRRPGAGGEKQPKLSRKREAHLVLLTHSGEFSTLWK
jgi:hypothetical protein